MSGIVVDAVSRSFGSVQAVQGATLRAEEGRVTGLVGPNGAGKTTLLLMLASLLAPDSGSIRIGGVDPASDPLAARRLLGWMPDALGAWPSLTARETIVTTARLYGISRSDAAPRAEQLLTLVGLGALADSPAKVLSRGQKQKLGLARALVHDPKVLLLDEPASGLDPEARVQLRVLLRRFAAEGRTVLISSHVLSELEEVVDDAVFLVAGSVVDAAPAQASARAWRIRLTGASPERLKADSWQVASTLGVAPESLGADRGAVLLGLPSEDAAAAALRRLVEAGLPVSEFAPAQSALEHTFLALREQEAHPAPASPPPPAPPADPTPTEDGA
ncbi:ABC transporter ATP-binding protein [Microbacterium saperdae]|uniref:ABC-type multidrug transport system ATPase subunit n=1 Tax=Microbacterium saperdae TaxID=69368 RepID=A0A543BQG2_9MICO|nr:ABC transporter ATP-binding protein [Microbacterium saperdae]TQL87066.1 ABC-type multidrug transport system ATPase subunit [Microbacterium saperdae]